MNRFSSLTLVLMCTLIVSACGARAAQATPTINAVDLQSTIAAAAFTVIAETRAALPTATPVPPTPTSTDTPPPTNTLPPLPPSGATLTPAPNGNSGAGDPCVNKVMPTSLPGETVKVRINNSTKAALAFSVYLNQTTPQSACGYRTYTIAAQESLVINDLVEGCYTLWAWNPIPEDYFIVTNGTTCMDDSVNWVFDISTGSIKLKQ
ncbi:MAG TPA: hypothetical protein VFY25_06585 [Anaerolineales bacterium]|nr:hypothetical protein [Anaerolineales bacterium]